MGVARAEAGGVTAQHEGWACLPQLQEDAVERARIG